MTVEELYNILKRGIENDNIHKDFANLEVVVITQDPSVGPRSFSIVKHANRGFDWEHGLFNLVTEDHLIKQGGTLTKDKIIMQQQLKNLNNPKNPE